MIEVGAAIIENEQCDILIARRRAGKSQAGLWEFPGGKLEPEESVEACIRRELHEEMNIVIEPYAYFGTNDHDYGTAVVRLIAYKARFKGGSIKLADHDDYRWVSRSELAGYTFAPADIPFVRMLQQGTHTS